jgi:cellulose synthase/poly-beta-1,6-N-acetylglucosamine synthase-like glycosyltransferase
VLTDPATGRNADGLYWKYESILKKNESRLGALLGANGAIYAIRKRLCGPIPSDTIIDDFVIPLRAKLQSGCSIVYDWEAIAREETAPDVGSEFHRRARIGAGGFQAIGMLSRLLNPRRGWVAFTFFSHKILRWLCPLLLIAMLLCSLLLVKFPLYRYLLVAQLSLYLTAALAAVCNTRVSIPRGLRLLVLFVGMNAALLVGLARWLSGRQKGSWRRTARVPTAS